MFKPHPRAPTDLALGAFSRLNAGPEAAKRRPRKRVQNQQCKSAGNRRRGPPGRGPKVAQKCSKITPKSTLGGHRALGVPPGGAQAPTQPQNDPKSDKIFDFSTATVTSLEAAYKQQPRRGQSPERAQISIFSNATVTSLATAYKRRPRRRNPQAHLSICSTAKVTS